MQDRRTLLQLDRGVPVEQALEDDPRLEPRDVRTEAGVRATTEGHVRAPRPGPARRAGRPGAGDRCG